MATCAAPAYFPSVPIDGEFFADGGLFAVAPDQVALHEAEHFLRIPASRVRMLSIGTGISNYRPASEVSEKDGAVDWLAIGAALPSGILLASATAWFAARAALRALP